jgi:DNA invertase Pin-like site-specific DNA recombinase
LVATTTGVRAALYARVSTVDKGQDPELQLAELRQHAGQRGWHVIGEFVDHASGTDRSRPQLAKLVALVAARKVDVVAVWRFDRFARSTAHLLEALEACRQAGVDFVSLREQFDTTTPMGKAMFTVTAAVAELERDLIRERVRAGVDRAKAAGKHCGRPKNDIDLRAASRLLQQGVPLRQVADMLHLPRTTLRRRLKEAGVVQPGADAPHSATGGEP